MLSEVAETARRAPRGTLVTLGTLPAHCVVRPAGPSVCMWLPANKAVCCARIPHNAETVLERIRRRQGDHPSPGRCSSFSAALSIP